MTIAKATLGLTPAAIYTSTSNTAVTFLSLCNFTSTATTINLYIVPNGSSADNTTLVYSNLQLTAHDTYQLYLGGEKLLLSAGDAVFPISPALLLPVTVRTV